MNSKVFMQENTNWIPSRCNYKKFGTIVEHLMECVNPIFYEVRIAHGSQSYTLVVRIYTFPSPTNIYPVQVWEFTWNARFNDKIYIPPEILTPAAEW